MANGQIWDRPQMPEKPTKKAYKKPMRMHKLGPIESKITRILCGSQN